MTWSDWMDKVKLQWNENWSTHDGNLNEDDITKQNKPKDTEEVFDPNTFMNNCSTVQDTTSFLGSQVTVGPDIPEVPTVMRKDLIARREDDQINALR